MRMKKLTAAALALALSVGGAFTASAGWVQEDITWKYQNTDSTWQANKWFQDADGTWYRFEQDGVMKTGWFQDTNGAWYFLSYSGAMQTGLIQVDGNVYFMNPSGDLFTGEKDINGRTYTFGLYGTIGVAPSVTANAKFGKTGNQSLNRGGGGGSSYIASTLDKLPAGVKAKATEVNNKVNDAINNISKDPTLNGVGVSFNPGEFTAVVDTSSASGIGGKEVVVAVTATVTSILNVVDDTDITVQVPGGAEITGSKESITAQMNAYAAGSNKNMSDYADQEGYAKVQIDGHEVIYKISVN